MVLEAQERPETEEPAGLQAQARLVGVADFHLVHIRLATLPAVGMVWAREHIRLATFHRPDTVRRPERVLAEMVQVDHYHPAHIRLATFQSADTVFPAGHIRLATPHSQDTVHP